MLWICPVAWKRVADEPSIYFFLAVGGVICLQRQGALGGGRKRNNCFCFTCHGLPGIPNVSASTVSGATRGWKNGEWHLVVINWRPSLLDADSGKEIRLPEIDGNLIPLAPVGAGEWVGQIFNSQQPAELVRFVFDDPDPEKFVSIAHVWERTVLTAKDLSPAEDLRWKSVDGLEIQGWLYRPVGKAHGMVVLVHGGPTYHSKDEVNPKVQYLVKHGFNVLEPNYRGSTGFDLAFKVYRMIQKPVKSVSEKPYAFNDIFDKLAEERLLKDIDLLKSELKLNTPNWINNRIG